MPPMTSSSQDEHVSIDMENRKKVLEQRLSQAGLLKGKQNSPPSPPPQRPLSSVETHSYIPLKRVPSKRQAPGKHVSIGMYKVVQKN